MKIDRLFTIINMLLNKKAVTAKELAEHFGVSIRTIYRDIDILSANGVPLYTTQGKGGGISILDNYTIDKALLSDEEQKEILMALQSLNATGQMNVKDSISKLGALFDKNTENYIEIDFSGWEQSDDEKEIFTRIKNGILHSTPISFSYYNNKGEKSERIVEPLKLVFKGYHWYLYGFCRKRKDYRVFKLKRMENLVSLDDTFHTTMPEKSDQLNHVRMNKYDSDATVALELKIHESMGFRVYDEMRTGKWKQDGDFMFVEVTLPDNEWLPSYLLSFGKMLEVVKPLELRDKMKNLLYEMYKNY